MNAGDIISYTEMCLEEGYSLQRGMNYQVNGSMSVILMSQRPNAIYPDRIEENGQVLIYEGHDVPKNLAPVPKNVDQTAYTPSGKLTQNGKFYEAAIQYKQDEKAPELVKVYEKIRDGIWVYNGIFELKDARLEKVKAEKRKVFKFKLEITDKKIKRKKVQDVPTLEHNRMIPTSVKLEVWKRDKGQCVKCGKEDNLHFDHILPFSKGGTSIKSENIQLMCARHNLQKSNKLE
jgi:hypothetical protein